MQGKSLDINKWAEIVVKEWIIKVQSMDIYDSFALADSFTHTAYTNANGDIRRVKFLFNYYGKFAEMAVGKGMPYDFAKSPGNKREERPWYTKTFFAQVHRLRELLQEKYAEDAGKTVSAAIIEEAESGRAALKGMGSVLT